MNSNDNTGLIHIPTEADNKTALDDFFGQIRQMKAERNAAVTAARPALDRLVATFQAQTGQSYKIRALLYSLWNGKPASLSEVLCLDWSLRQDLVAVLLAFGADDFFYDAVREAVESVDAFDWFVEEHENDSRKAVQA
jgi:hypothetical protein